jgi:hypothetical protein
MGAASEPPGARYRLVGDTSAEPFGADLGSTRGWGRAGDPRRQRPTRVDRFGVREDDVAVRASDRLREWTVARLRGAYVDGALSTDTFELRTGQAYRSRTREQLWWLLDDLSSPWQQLWQRSRGWLRSFLVMPAPNRGPGGSRCRAPVKPGERILVGRDHTCDVVLCDPVVSRRHLSIRCRGKRGRPAIWTRLTGRTSMGDGSPSPSSIPVMCSIWARGRRCA